MTPVVAARVAAALLCRPRLWGAALRLVPPRWWRRRPPWPFPDRGYRAFRVQTMYGDRADLEPADVVAYLDWCRRMRPPAS